MPIVILLLHLCFNIVEMAFMCYVKGSILCLKYIGNSFPLYPDMSKQKKRYFPQASAKSALEENRFLCMFLNFDLHCMFFLYHLVPLYPLPSGVHHAVVRVQEFSFLSVRV